MKEDDLGDRVRGREAGTTQCVGVALMEGADLLGVRSGWDDGWVLHILKQEAGTGIKDTLGLNPYPDLWRLLELQLFPPLQEINTLPPSLDAASPVLGLHGRKIKTEF